MAKIVLTDADRDRIKQAIAAAEGRTAGEIFVVVARASDDYRFVPLLWATLVALIVPLPLIFLTFLPVIQIYLIQLVVFVLVALILSLPAVKPLVIPGTIKATHAHRLAVDQFLAHGLHMTQARTGVLIFVSLAERYAEVVADAGIHSKVGQAVWDGIIADLLAEIRAGHLADGLIGAIEKSGDVLAAHFPPGTADQDELPNELIII